MSTNMFDVVSVVLSLSTSNSHTKGHYYNNIIIGPIFSTVPNSKDVCAQFIYFTHYRTL